MSGRLIGFNLLGEEWPIEPPTCFYDWLYISALIQHPDAVQELLNFHAFSDIAFNPEKSLNCQARSAAVFRRIIEPGNPFSDNSKQDSVLGADWE